MSISMSSLACSSSAAAHPFSKMAANKTSRKGDVTGGLNHVFTTSGGKPYAPVPANPNDLWTPNNPKETPPKNPRSRNPTEP